jgi:hypothetical protein
VPVGEAGVVEAQLMEDGGVEIVNVNLVFDGGKAEVIG